MTVERIVYFGTPEFAVAPLEALVESDRAPALVVTQPSRRKGRGMAKQQSAVSRTASELGLSLVEVESVRDGDFLEQLTALNPDLAVVAAFGQIFDVRLLQIPRLGCLNIHASLLPAFRGASPIQAAIAAGESETGISLMWMEEGLDTGPVLARRVLAIGPDETAPELSERLAAVGAEVLIETLVELDDHRVAGEPQDDDQASYAPQLRRSDGRVDWRLSATALYNRWRAFQPWPGLFIKHGGEQIKLERVGVVGVIPDSQPGIVVQVGSSAMTVACGDDRAVTIEAARRPGRAAVSGRDLANGLRLQPGDVFGLPVAGS